MACEDPRVVLESFVVRFKDASDSEWSEGVIDVLKSGTIELLDSNLKSIAETAVDPVIGSNGSNLLNREQPWALSSSIAVETVKLNRERISASQKPSERRMKVKKFVSPFASSSTSTSSNARKKNGVSRKFTPLSDLSNRSNSQTVAKNAKDPHTKGSAKVNSDNGKLEASLACFSVNYSFDVRKKRKKFDSGILIARKGSSYIDLVSMDYIEQCCSEDVAKFASILKDDGNASLRSRAYYEFIDMCARKYTKKEQKYHVMLGVPITSVLFSEALNGNSCFSLSSLQKDDAYALNLDDDDFLRCGSSVVELDGAAAIHLVATSAKGLTPSVTRTKSNDDALAGTLWEMKDTADPSTTNEVPSATKNVKVGSKRTIRSSSFESPLAAGSNARGNSSFSTPIKFEDPCRWNNLLDDFFPFVADSFTSIDQYSSCLKNYSSSIIRTMVAQWAVEYTQARNVVSGQLGSNWSSDRSRAERAFRQQRCRLYATSASIERIEKKGFRSKSSKSFDASKSADYFVLRFPRTSMENPLTVYGKFDVWVVASPKNPSADLFAPNSNCGIFVSSFFGIKKTDEGGQISLVGIPGINIPSAFTRTKDRKPIVALRCGNIYSEIMVQRCVRSMKSAYRAGTFPLAPILWKSGYGGELGVQASKVGRFNAPQSQGSVQESLDLNLGNTNDDILNRIRDELLVCISRFRPNVYQEQVLVSTLRWLGPSISDHLLNDVTIQTALRSLEAKEKATASVDEQCNESVLLVHGVFGSGKSTTLVHCIMFLCRAFQILGVRRRILVCSLTNAAVDRILSGLQDNGFTDFFRVGCLKNIASNLLERTLAHSYRSSSKFKDNQDVVKEIQEMISSCGDKDSTKKKDLERALVSFQRQNLKDRIESLKSVSVIGSTVASCCLGIIDRAICEKGSSPKKPNKQAKDIESKGLFDIVVLDECSQMTEPQTLIPLCRFGCKKCLLVGDPKQLPPFSPSIPSFEEHFPNCCVSIKFLREIQPTLSGRELEVCKVLLEEQKNSASSSDSVQIKNIPKELIPVLVSRFQQLTTESTLFERLAGSPNLKRSFVALWCQYRCHSEIGRMASKLFYEGKVVQGVEDNMRQPVLVDMNPIMWVATNGQAEVLRPNSPYYHSSLRHSLCNLKEASRVCGVVKHIFEQVGCTERCENNEDTTDSATTGLNPNCTNGLVEGSLVEEMPMPSVSIGIVSLYKAQKVVIQSMLEANGISNVDVSTVDAFQGAERDIIIVSPVRSASPMSASQANSEFICDARRFNVMITRAKKHLVFVGNPKSFIKLPYWKDIVRKCFSPK